MASSSAEKLYRSVRGAVILTGLALMLGQVGSAQFARREIAPKKNKGPRAIGLLELPPTGKAHLLPITILYDGKFYDASVYKAAPVPMALESGTVYEAVHTGISLGLFTVTGALQTKDSWLGAGNWQPAGSVKPKKKVVASTPPEEDADGPPVLRRREGTPPAETPPPSSKPETTPTAPAAPTPSAPPPSTAPAPPASTPEPSPTDDNHPVLKHGKQLPFEDKEDKQALSAAKASPKTAPPPPVVTAPKASGVQLIPAVSDAHGPDPLPFKYEVKPDEEAVFRKKVLALASDEVDSRAKTLAAEAIAPGQPAKSASRGKAAVKPPQPAFENVDLRIFDLTNANEPIVVLTAMAHMPQTGNTTASQLQYYVTLVARSDIYGDLHRAFVNISDSQHLDILPRMELIDAVDADGDGRGELLFRQTSDAGSAFVIYRVIGDSVYALYQGTPTGG